MGETRIVDTHELLAHIDRRFADSERSADIRHRDVVRRVENLDHKVAKAHGRISTHDGLIAALTSRVQEIADRYHTFVNHITTMVQSYRNGNGSKTSSGDTQPITRMDAKWIVSIILGTILATLGVLKFFGKL